MNTLRKIVDYLKWRYGKDTVIIRKQYRCVPNKTYLVYAKCDGTYTNIILITHDNKEHELLMKLFWRNHD